MEETKFTGVAVAITCAKTGQRVTVSGLSRFVVWRSFGAESHTGPVELPVLLVGNVRRREGLAEAVHNLHKEEIAQQPSSSTGYYAHRSSMGSNCDGYS